MKKEKIEIWALILVGLVAFGVLFNVLMKYILPCILPFFIAWAVAFAVRGPAHLISTYLHVSERILRPALAIIGTLLGFTLILILFWRLGDFLWRFLGEVAAESRTYEALVKISQPALPFFDVFPKEISVKIGECISGILMSFVETLARFVTSVAVALPEALISILITTIAIVYFAIDLDKINNFIKSFFPKKYREKISKIRIELFAVLGKYIKSYLQIMGITFVIMLVGLLILRVKSAVIIAAVISLLDLLPVLGVGAVLLPWSAFAILVGDSGLGIGLIVLFIVYTVIREAAEPKIFGKSLDVHPVISLISLYVGFSLFGFLGMLIFPIVAVVITGLLKKNKSAEIS